MFKILNDKKKVVVYEKINISPRIIQDVKEEKKFILDI